MKHALEGSKIFPYLAWGVVLLFFIFVFFLLSELKKSTAFLEEKTQQNIAAMKNSKASKR